FPPALRPSQTVRPSLLQRLSVCLLHARRRPPAATHEAIPSPHACRHCLASETASAADAMRNTASTAGGAVNRRILAPCLIPLPPQRSPEGASRAPGNAVAGGARANIDPPAGSVFSPEADYR